MRALFLAVFFVGLCGIAAGIGCMASAYELGGYIQRGLCFASIIAGSVSVTVAADVLTTD